MKDEEGLDPVDLAFAQAVTTDAVLHPFCSYLLRAVRQGHVCCRIDGENVSPPPHEIWAEGEAAWQQTVVQGAKMVPEGASEVFFRQGAAIYLKKCYDYETRCLTHLRRLLDAPPRVKIDPARLEERLKQLPLTDEQAQAIRQSAFHSLLVLTGGPGSGKTFTAGHLLSLLQECAEEELSIVVAAPTGKAAAQVESSLRKAGLTLSAQTLHRLLQIKTFPRWDDSSETCPADLILVDETSMVDLPIMARLLASVKTGARLILLGDPQQLPPVEVGQCFADLVSAMKTLADPPLMSLTVCLRAENRALVTFANHIREANVEELSLGEGDVVFHPVEETHSKQSWKEACLPSFFASSPEEALQNLGAFRLLSPLRKGAWGVETWNKLFSGEKRRGMPILITRTDETLGLPNGTLGILWDDTAYFPSFSLPAVLLPTYEPAFCLSVHKSQGSEFDHVVLFLPEGSEVFGKEMIYTAATRAKKKLEIVTTKEILRATLERKCGRISGLVQRISQNGNELV